MVEGRGGASREKWEGNGVSMMRDGAQVDGETEELEMWKK